MVIDGKGRFCFANSDAEQFFSAGLSYLVKRRLQDFVPADSPLFALIEQVRQQQSRISEYRVDISSPRLGGERMVDLYVSHLSDEPDLIVVMIQLRSIAEKMDRQLTHRSAARTVTGLAAMLAHEIRNPLSGIKGAAQLLATSASDEDRGLTRLIQEESDRIVKLVDRMEVFSDQRPIERSAVNIHSVLEHVKTLGKNGFARGIKITELYDPSLPPVYANRDQLVQVFLNLLKNAAEAVRDREDGEIRLLTAFRPGRAPVRPRHQGPRHAAAGVHGGGQWRRRARGHPGAHLRPLRDHQAVRLRPRPRARRQDRRRPWRGHRVRSPSRVTPSFRILMPAWRELPETPADRSGMQV